MRQILAVCLFFVSACSAPATHGHDGGDRILSNNPCIDAVLLELVEPGRIAAISHYSQTSNGTSIDLATARRFRSTGGTAEEIIAERPDVALVGAHTPAGTISAVEKAGIRVEIIGVANSVADSLAQVRAIGDAVGEPERADALAQRIAAAATPVQVRTHAGPSSVLVWQRDGMVPGPGTLFDELLTRAGLHNAAQDYGLGLWDILPLEPAAVAPPDIVLLPEQSDGNSFQMRERWLRDHGGTVERVEMPARMLFCGGPTIIEAMELLHSVRAAS